VALALVLAGCNPKAPGAGAGPGGRPTGPVEVAVITVAPEALTLTTELPGRTAAYRVAEVRPQVTGIIQKRLFTEGGEVQAGQQLYQIDPAPYQATLESAKADIVKAQANLKSVEAKAARYADLVKINAVSRQDYDDQIATLDQARAQILVAKAAFESARINLDYTKVYAPISGRIGKSSVTEGALVTASQATTLATVTQLDPIYVDVSQSSAELLRLRRAVAAGQVQSGAAASAPVTLRLDGVDQPYDQPGRMQFSEVTVDPSTGAVLLRVVFPNPRQELYPGLFVRTLIEQGVKPDALLVPQQALVRQPDGSAQVWVVGEGNKVAPRPVTAERSVAGRWLITKGLEPGQQVVVEGLQKIRPGVEVKTVPAAAAVAATPPGRS